MRLIVLSCQVLVFATGALQCLKAGPVARAVSWSELQPAIKFDDPYEKLDPEQQIDLSILARLQDLEDAGESGRMIERKRQEASGARERLEQQGIDIETLLARRYQIAELHLKRSAASEKSIEGKQIRLPGYLLPLKVSGGVVNEFLLVPWVGACIHTPPPPPNQIVHLEVPGGVTDPGRFSPVWIEGVIERKLEKYPLFLLDGRRDIEVAYTMATGRISPYSPGESDILSQVEIPDTIGTGHSLLRQWQLRADLLFTKAMTDIQNSRSSGPFLWGLLVAFLYGILHTLGPGHGKAVVVAYFLGERGSLGRGLRMGGQIALFHVLSAVTVVVIADLVIRQATGQSPSDYRLIRLASYGSIIVIGLWMTIQALGAARSAHHRHHHEGCGCGHHADPGKGVGGFLALAVGAVPCTGALLVLLFGLANDLLWPSVALVIAISLGMALALSGIGVAAILGRRFLDRRVGQDASRQGRTTAVLRIVGATAILLVGCLLFAVAW